jgi:acetyl-CoA decarbonylase/synthase complex subunit delta
MAKEALVSEAEHPNLGAQKDRFVAWEAVTATALLQSGADILVMRHPKAVEYVNTYIKNVMI